MRSLHFYCHLVPLFDGNTSDNRYCRRVDVPDDVRHRLHRRVDDVVDGYGELNYDVTG